jgi:hypothetical protein
MTLKLSITYIDLKEMTIGFVKKCAMKGDKGFMMKHPCNNINNNK